MSLVGIALSILAGAPGPETATPEPVRLRLADLDGDGLPERIVLRAGGGLVVERNLGARRFDRVEQDLPCVRVQEVLAEDLDGDGHRDLYLLAEGPDLALLGDGTGRLFDRTRVLGLEDVPEARSVESIDVDGDGRRDLVLSAAAVVVVFWADVAGYVGSSDPGPAGHPSPSEVARQPYGKVDLAPGTPGPEASAPASQPQRPCRETLLDVSTGDCVEAASTEGAGRFLALGENVFVEAGTGHVGISTVSPTERLTVAGRLSVQAIRFPDGSIQMGLPVGLVSVVTDGVREEEPLSSLTVALDPVDEPYALYVLAQSSLVGHGTHSGSLSQAWELEFEGDRRFFPPPLGYYYLPFPAQSVTFTREDHSVTIPSMALLDRFASPLGFYVPTGKVRLVFEAANGATTHRPYDVRNPRGVDDPTVAPTSSTHVLWGLLYYDVP